MAQINKVTERKTLKVVNSFTNGFAQNVIELEDGTMLMINYGQTEVEVLKTEPLETPEAVLAHINSIK